jgi:multisubunit Na+/H+ antiporter MnhF subunit
MSLFHIVLAGLMLILALSMGGAVWRLLRGPSIPDRAAAFDMIMTHLVGLVAMFVIAVDQLVLVDAVIVVSVLGFLGTVALARFIEEGRT